MPDETEEKKSQTGNLIHLPGLEGLVSTEDHLKGRVLEPENNGLPEGTRDMRTLSTDVSRQQAIIDRGLDKFKPIPEIEEYLDTMKRFHVVGSNGDKRLTPQAIDFLAKDGFLPYVFNPETGELTIAVSTPMHNESFTVGDFLLRVPTFYDGIIPKEMKDKGLTPDKIRLQYLNGKLIEKLLPFVRNPNAITEYRENNLRFLGIEKSIFETDSRPKQIVHDVLRYAIERRASDVHFEAEGTHFRVRLRVDGDMEEYPERIPPKDYLGSVAVLKNECGEGVRVEERRKPQDGRMSVAPGVLKDGKAADYDLRVAFMPTVSGDENVVIRIVERFAFKSTEEMGINPRDHEKIMAAIREPHGVILLTGPTGSGKTTTIYGLLKKLNTGENKIITCEDPVEGLMNGVEQVPYNEAAGITFETFLRNAVRRDPDVIMVGEIRDSVTAQLATNAAMTGHLVLSTLHTNNAPDAIPRLLGLGVHYTHIADAMLAVVAQRLVKVFNPKIREDLENGIINPRLKAVDAGLTLNELTGANYFAPGSVFYDGPHECFLGRSAITEIWNIDETAKRTFSTGKCDLATVEKVAYDSGMYPMCISGIEKVAQGLTSINQVAREVGYATFRNPQNIEILKKILT